MMRAGKETNLATLPPNPDAGETSATPGGPTSVGGAPRAEESGKPLQPRPEPGKAKSASKDAEWLIDESTKRFYLSLFSPREARAPQPKAPPARMARRGKKPARTPGARSKAQPIELAIKLGDVRESRAYLLTALILLISFALYEVISRSGGSGQEAGAKRRISLVAASPASGATGQTAVERGPKALPPVLLESGVVGAPTLNVAPTLILADVPPEQTTTYTLTVNNLTPQEFTFELAGKDLVLKDGKAVFLVPGEIPDSVAVNLVFSKKAVNLKPMQSSSFDVTVSMPNQTHVRGVLIILKGSDQISVVGQTEMTASLGTLISFARAERVTQEATASSQKVPASAASFTVTQWLSDPVPECRASNDGLATSSPVGNALGSPSGGRQP